jgi:ferritin-like metal-binding protein YciE
MADISAGDSKLVQYLNEAYGTEMRLETALQEHITMAERPTYRNRLKDHLSETRRHAREVKQAINRLGGTAETISAPGPQPVADVAQAAVGAAQKAVALAQGPLHMLRGTGAEEKQLKNAKTEFASEAEEIATYTAIETLAAALGKREVQQLARGIRREEERMRSFLEKEIAQLTKAVVKAEIPAAERNGKPARRKGSRKRTAGAAASARSTGGSRTAKSRSSAGKASGAKKAAASGAKKAATRGKASAGGAKKAAARGKASASRAKTSATRKTAAAGSGARKAVAKGARKASATAGKAASDARKGGARSARNAVRSGASTAESGARKARARV